MRTEPAFRREAAATWGIKIWKKDRSVFGRNWQARRIAGSPPAPTRSSTKASRFDGAGSELQSPTTRIRQVEHRARPPQTLACGMLLRRLASSTLRPFGTRTVLPDPSSGLIEAENGKRRNESRCRQQKRRCRLEERLHLEPEIQSNAAVNPRYDQNNEHQPHLVWPYSPVRVKHLRVELLMLKQYLAEPHTGKVGDDKGRDT